MFRRPASASPASLILTQQLLFVHNFLANCDCPQSPVSHLVSAPHQLDPSSSLDPDAASIYLSNNSTGFKTDEANDRIIATAKRVFLGGAMSAKINAFLTDLCHNVSAASCTFYIRDPIWKNGFRLVGMTGVQHSEPMHGFSFPATARDVISHGPREHFSENAFSDPVLREDSRAAPKVPLSRRVLFGDFVARENVKSCARLIYPAGRSPEQAVLFVNFTAPTIFSRNLKRRIKNAFSALVDKVPTLRDELSATDASALTKSARILSPDSTIAGESMSRISGGLQGYLEEILGSAIEALELDRKTLLGTIHLYDAENQHLVLAASVGQIDHLDRATRHSVKDGQGVISWVFLRRRAILIEDLNVSAYSAIHVSLNDGVRSELAVPMVNGELVIGVICLESLNVSAFVPGDVRSLWYAANRAAVACRFYKEISISKRLLAACSSATALPPVANTLNELAAITREHLDAALCDIWKYDADRGEFDKAGVSGASSSAFEPDIRVDGWSEFIRTCRNPVWIFDISNITKFKVLVETNGQWKKKTPGEDCPALMNPKPVGQGVRCELWLPIVANGECVGVAWVKYKRNLEVPTADFITLARGFAAQVALVLGVIRNRVELEHRLIAETRIREHLVGRFDLSAIGRIEGQRVSISGGGILGGDYCCGVSISKGRGGLLLLDGEGHGMRGSLNMLPLAGGFAALSDIGSATYVMDKLIKIAHDVGARATALYCIFMEIDGRLYISATCAGHLPIILLRRVGGIIERKDIPSLNSSARGAPLWELNPWPVTDETVELQTGDLLVGYTDGVTDGVDDTLSRAGICALSETALEENTTPLELTEIIINKVVRTRKPDGEADDATVFVIKVK